MEALRKKNFIGIREDDKYLASKLYQGVLSAAHKQKQPEIQASELKNLKVEDDISKIIDNLVNIYELKLNDILILQNGIIDEDYDFMFEKLPASLVKLLRNITIYNNIIVSWNGLIKLLYTGNLPKLTQDFINQKLSTSNTLYKYINDILERSLELIENLLVSKHFIIEQLFKFMVVSYILKKQIENSNYRIITLQELELFGSNLKNQLSKEVQQELINIQNIQNKGLIVKSQFARFERGEPRIQARRVRREPSEIEIDLDRSLSDRSLSDLSSEATSYSPGSWISSEEDMIVLDPQNWEIDNPEEERDIVYIRPVDMQDERGNLRPEFIV